MNTGAIRCTQIRADSILLENVPAGLPDTAKSTTTTTAYNTYSTEDMVL